MEKLDYINPVEYGVNDKIYGYSNKNKTVSSYNTQYDRSLEQTPIDDYELEADFSKENPNAEFDERTWLSQAKSSFDQKRNEIMLMTERSKLVKDINPELEKLVSQLSNTDDPYEIDKINKRIEDLNKEKDEIIGDINDIEAEEKVRKETRDMQAFYKMKEYKENARSGSWSALKNVDYWMYAVPGTAGSSFSDVSSYIAGLAGWAASTAVRGIGSAIIGASGGVATPLGLACIAGVEAIVGLAITGYGLEHSNRSESLAETYGAYKDKVTDNIKANNYDLANLIKKTRLENQDATKDLNDEQIVDKLLTGELTTNDKDFNQIAKDNSKNLNYTYDRNRALITTEALELGLNLPFLPKLVSKIPGAKQVATGTQLIGKALGVTKGYKRLSKYLIDWNLKLAKHHKMLYATKHIPTTLLKYGVSASLEGIEEGSQNIINRKFREGDLGNYKDKDYDGKYGGLSDAEEFYNANKDLLENKWQIAKMMLGFDTTSALAKDQEMWSEIMGGVAIGLLMGAPSQVTSSTNRVIEKYKGANVYQQIALDNLDKNHKMFRIGQYADKGQSLINGNGTLDVVTDLLNKTKESDQSIEGVSNEDIDNEIKLINNVKNDVGTASYFNKVAKAAGYEKRSREYNTLLGLRYIYKEAVEDDKKALQESSDELDAIRKEYDDNRINRVSVLESLNEADKAEFKRDLTLDTQTSRLIKEYNYLKDLREEIKNGSESSSKFGLLNDKNPLTKDVLELLDFRIKEHEQLFNKRLSKSDLTEAEKQEGIKLNVFGDEDVEKRYKRAYFENLLLGSQLNRTITAFNDVNVKLTKDNEVNNKQIKAAKKRVDDYLNGVNDTLAAEKSAADEINEIEGRTKPEEKEDVITDEGKSINKDVIDDTVTTHIPQKSEITDKDEKETLSPDIIESSETESDTYSEEDTITAWSEEDTEPEVYSEDVQEPDVYSEYEDEVETTKVKTTKKEGSEEDNVHKDKIESDVPTEFSDKLNNHIEQIDDASNDDVVHSEEDTTPDVYSEEDTVPEAFGYTEDDIDMFNRLERVLDEPLNNESSVNKSLGIESKDPASETLFFASLSNTPMVVNGKTYKSGKELNELLNKNPGILNICITHFEINTNYKQGSNFDKNYKTTWDDVAVYLIIEDPVTNDKYAAALKDIAGAKKLIEGFKKGNGERKYDENTTKEILDKLRENRNTIIEATLNGKVVKPTRFTSTNGKYALFHPKADGTTVQIPIQHNKSMNIPKDYADINDKTVDVAIGGGVLGHFKLFRPNGSTVKGTGGSGNLFLIIPGDKTFTGEEVPVKLNVSRFTDEQANVIFGLMKKAVIDGDLTAKRLLTIFVNYGFVADGKRAMLPFLVEKQFYFDETTNQLHLGSKTYDITEIDNNRNEIIDKIKTFHWNIDKDTLTKRFFEIFTLPEIKTIYNYDFSNTEISTPIKGIDGKITYEKKSVPLKITRDQYNDYTLLGWMIENQLIKTNLREQLFENAFYYYHDLAIEEPINQQDTVDKTNLSVDSVVETVETKAVEQVNKQNLDKNTISDDINDLIEGVGLYRKVKSPIAATKKVTEAEKQWFYKALGLTEDDVEVVDKAIELGNNTWAMGLCKLYSTVLWTGAEEGTLYHEAYHRVSMLLLSPEERNRIYNFYRKKYKAENATENEVEESLAELFREYMLDKNKADLNILQRIFQKLMRFIKRWTNRSSYEIDSLFNKISTNYYANYQNNPKSVKQWINRFTENGALPFKYHGTEFKTITNTQFEEIVKSLTGLSFRIFRIKYAKDLEKMNISKLKLIFSPENVEKLKERSFTEDQLSRYSEIYDNWETVFEPAIKEELSRFKIRFKTKKEEDSELQNKANGDELTGDQEGTADELGKHTKEVGEISIKNNALSEVKMWVAALPNLKFDTVNGKQTLVSVRNSLLGMATTVNYDKAWTLISTAFAHCNEFDEMLDEAAKLGKDNAFFKTVYTSLSQLLKAVPNETLEDKLYRENMQTMIRNTFSKHTMEYIFCLVENIDGTSTMYLKNENRNATTSNVIKEWLNNLIDNSGLVIPFSGGFLPNKKNKEGGAYNQNYEKIVKDIKNEFAILINDALNNKIDNSNVTDYARRTVSLIQKIGIDIDEKVLDQFLKDTFNKTSKDENLTAFLKTTGPGTFEAFVSYRLDDLKNIGFDGSFKISKRQSSLEQLIKDDKFVKQLAEAYAKVNPSETEITVRTTDGKMLQTITEKNYLTDHTNDLNRSLEEVNAHNQTAYISGKTVYDNECKGSRLIDSLLRGKHYKVCTITGFKELGSNDQGRRYKEISQLEDYVMKLTLVHNNFMLLPTMGDSVRYDVLYGDAIKSLPAGVFKNNDKLMVSRETLECFCMYFETELETIQYNYQHQPTEDKDKIKNYDIGDRNGYRLRHFNGIELPFTNKDGSKLNINEDLRKAEENNVNIIDTILEKWNALEQFQKYEIMNKFLMKQLTIDLNSAQKLGIITWDGENLQSVKNVALPGNLLKDFSYLPEVSLISEFCFNQMSSLIEFEKIYTGDIAYYENPEDYTKRLREVLSTGVTPRTQYEAGSEMNALKEFNVATFKDNKYPSRQINEIIESAKKSYIYKLLQKDGYNNKEIKQMISDNKIDPEVIEQATILAETNFKGYRKVNQTDATVLLSPEGYKQLARRFFGWKPKIAEAFEYLNSLKAITDENVEQYQKSLGTLIKPLKCMYFGVNRNAALRREIPIFDKMAMFPVFPLLATGDMKMVLDKMNDPKNPIHMIAFESAVKVGQDVKSSMYKDDGVTLNENGEQSLSNIITHKQSLNNFRWQMSTDPHASHEQMFVTQALKAAILNVRQNNTYTTQSGESISGKTLLNNLFNCLNHLSIRGSKKLLKKYGIKEGKFNKEKTFKNIYDSAKASHMNQNVLEALQDTNIPLSGVSNSSWIEASIISDINSEVIDITTPGGMFIQMSSVTYNGLTIRSDEGMRSLRFNREDNSVECCVSINLLKSIIPDYDKKTFKQVKDWLIKNGVIGNDKPAMSMGYRIPAQGPSSVVALTVVDVYPEQIGDTITLPDEWTALTGSDFD